MTSCYLWGLFLALEVVMIVAIPATDEFVIQREKLKGGFHREVRTEVTWQAPGGEREADTGEVCAFLLEETIPPGMYADMDQLTSLQQFGGPMVLSDRPINIEAPAHLSTAHTLHVFLPSLKRPAPSSSSSAAVTVPLHLRYHLPSTDSQVTHVTVALGEPSLYTNCSMAGSAGEKLACGEGQGMCTWWKVHFQGSGQALEFDVPVGQLQHFPLVLSLTLAVTLLGCLVVCTATPGKNVAPDPPHRKSR